MNVKYMAEELIKKLPIDTHEHLDLKRWKYYNSLNGYLNDKYFDLYFRETINGRKTIEISHNTEKPDVILKMIKNINKKAKVTYTQTTTKEVTT